MKRSFTKLIAALALLAVFAMPMKAWATDIIVAMTGYAGGTSNSYVNSNTESMISNVTFVACGYIPSSGQVRGNKTSIAASSSGNFHIYNTSEMPGAITQIVMSISNASSTNCFQNKMYAATGTSSQASVSSIVGLSAGTLSSDGSSFTWTFDEDDGITYFKLCSTEKFTKGSVTGCSIEITYATSGGGITQLTAPANFSATAGSAQATFSWTEVEHASSYTILAKNGDTWDNPTTLFDNVSLTNGQYVGTGLSNGTTYVCKVRANGDGTNYSNSALSEATATFTPTAAQQYTVTIANGITGGTIGANPTTATAGTEISLTKEPAAGYGFTSWNVYKTGDQNTTVTVTSDKFSMPAYDVTVSATFTAYVVTLHAGNGTVAGAQTAAWNVSMNNGNLPSATPPCNAWTFYGWKTTSALGEQTTTAPTCVNGTGYAPTGNITLYAVYKKTEGGGSFDGTNGGDFLIYANDGGTNYYALFFANNGTSGKLPSTTSSSEAETFTFEKLTGSGYGEHDFAIKHGSLYLKYGTSGTDLGTQATAYKWTITENQSNTNGTWRIAASSGSNRGLLFQDNNQGTPTHQFGGYFVNNVDGVSYFDVEIGGGSTTYYHSTPDCTEHLSAPVVTLEAGNGSITPSWETVTNANSYTMQYGTNENFTTGTYTENTSATSGTAITGLTNGTTYYVRVKAVPAANSSYAESAWSTVVSAEPTAITIPTPEISLFEGYSTGTANEYVDVASFKFTVENQSEYILYYTLDGTDPTTSQTAVDYTYDDEVIIDETTTIKVVATDLTDYSDIAELTVTIKPITPISTVFAAGDSDNTYYYIEGIMTYKKDNSNRYVEDENAGILVYGNNSSIAVGDKLIIKGTKTTYNGKPEFKNITLIANISHNNTLPCHEINISQASDYMHRRVKYTQVLVGETNSSVTTISQGNNSIGVYNMPSVTNVTDEGYYLKSITGIVGYYNTNSTNQMYVVSDDIVPYAITASSNNTALGTVETIGYVVTATPADGIGYANPAYVEVTDATDYDVQQEGNTFTIVTNGDVEIEIQFAAAATYTISYTTNGIAETATTQVLQSSGVITELIEPTAANIPNGYTFMGWTTSAISGTQNFAPDLVEVGDVIDDDLALIAVFAIDKITSLTYDKVASNTSNIVNGTYLIAVNKVDSKNYNFANGNISDGKAGVEATGVATATVYLPSNIPSGAKEYTIAGDNTNGFLIHCSSGYLHAANAGNLSYNNSADNSEKWKFSEKDQGFVLTGANGGTKTSCNSTNPVSAIRNYASTGSHYYPLFFFKKNETHEYSNYCTSVAALDDNILPINQSFELTEDFTITTGTYYLDIPVIVPNGKTLTVNGTLGNSDPDFLVVKDGGRLVVYNECVQATVEKEVEHATYWGNATTYDADHWYFIASPVNGAAFPTGTTNTQDLYMLDWANNNWLNLQNTSHNSLLTAGFQRGTGYLYASKDDNTLSMAGEIQPLSNSDNATVTLANDGWNLIGNPLTCKVTVDKAFSELTNASTVTNSASGSAINPCQGIAVWGSANDVVTFTKAATQNAAAPSNNSSLQMTLSQNIVTRGNTTSTTVDNAVVSFKEGSILPKFSMLEGNAKLYIPQGKEQYAIVSAEAQGEMPVNFTTTENGEYTITVNAENVEMNYLHLIDNMTGADIDLLTTPSYTFNAKWDDYDSRFRLVFSANNANTENGNEDFAFISNGQIIINDNLSNATLQTVDMLGRVVNTQQVNGNTASMAPVANGVYVLRLINGNDVKTQKIVVR